MQAIPMLMMAGSTISGVTAFVGANYQAQVASQNAQAMEKAASDAAQKNSADAQDQDQRANLEMGQVLADASASGLDVNSGSTMLRRTSLQSLADRDRDRITKVGSAEIESNLTAAADLKGEARMGKFNAGATLLSTPFNAYSSYLDGTNLVAKRKGLQIGNAV